MLIRFMVIGVETLYKESNMTNLEHYADQCVAEWLRRQMQEEYLCFADADEDEIEEILKSVQS